MQQLFMDLLYAVLYAFIMWGIQAIVRIVVPYFKAKLSTTQYTWATEIVTNAVHAFEQTVSGSGRGEEKFELVIDQVKKEFDKIGIKLSEDQITILIEAAVQELNKYRISEPAISSVDTVFYSDENVNLFDGDKV